MFKSARIKLAGWYLLVMAVVVFFFSSVIYVALSRELERGFRRAQMLNRTTPPALFNNGFSDLSPEMREKVAEYFVQDIKKTRQNLLKRIVLIDGLILFVSAGLSYFLAGKSLAPIAKAMDKQKRFVADASHELRTPLAALKATTEVVLRDKKLDKRQAIKALESNLEEVDDLSGLANKLLTLSHYDYNGNSLKKSVFSLKEFILEATGKFTSLAREKKISFKKDLLPGDIKADKSALQEVCSVLLDNAVKYTPPGGQITVKNIKQKKVWKISITDTGTGIAQEDLPHIFERFWRADKARQKPSSNGYGLGLALAKEIVELHQGKIEVESKIGQGTTFTVLLPIA